jgi:hypothetical protein
MRSRPSHLDETNKGPNCVNYGEEVLALSDINTDSKVGLLSLYSLEEQLGCRVFMSGSAL